MFKYVLIFIVKKLVSLEIRVLLFVIIIIKSSFDCFVYLLFKI